MNPLPISKLLVQAAQYLEASLDPFRNMDHDIKEAKEHVAGFDDNLDLYTFKIKKVKNLPLSSLGSYDDYKPWLDFEPEELMDLPREEMFQKLRNFRGAQWAEKALKWIEQDGIPAIIIVRTPEFLGVADGRGRVNLAIGLGIRSIPAVIMESNVLPHQKDNLVDKIS